MTDTIARTASDAPAHRVVAPADGARLRVVQAIKMWFLV